METLSKQYLSADFRKVSTSIWLPSASNSLAELVIELFDW